MKRTPLYAAHVALGARMAAFGGWDMPIQYGGILAEHHHARRNVSVFDTGHMGEFELDGPTALSDLERLLTQSIAGIHVGQCRYGYLLRNDGGVLDDLTCYRRAADRFLLVVNAGTLDGDREWIRSRLSPETRFRDLSRETAKLDVQGPASRAAMERVFEVALPDLGYFRFAETTLQGADCILSRTGYTGEWGYEIYFPAARAVEFWERLLRDAEVKPAGLGARDTLRIEVGYPLYGHELSTERTPVPATHGQFIDPSKDFIGRDAVERDLRRGVAQVLTGLKLETKRAARAQDTVLKDGKKVGFVTSGSIAPSLGFAVAMAYVNRELATPGTALQVGVHGDLLPAMVTDMPFYTRGTARKLCPES
jgi:aminomethyltransferase